MQSSLFNSSSSESQEMQAKCYWISANNHFKSGKLTPALQDCDQYQALKPNDLSVYVLRGMILRGLGKWDEAIGVLSYFTPDNPNFCWAMFSRADCYEKKALLEDAVQDYFSVISAPNLMPSDVSLKRTSYSKLKSIFSQVTSPKIVVDAILKLEHFAYGALPADTAEQSEINACLAVLKAKPFCLKKTMEQEILNSIELDKREVDTIQLIRRLILVHHSDVNFNDLQNCSDGVERSWIGIAVLHQQLDVLKMFVDQCCASVNRRKEKSIPPIDAAVQAVGKAQSEAEKQTAMEIVKFLLKRGADVNLLGSASKTTLYYAILIKSMDCVRLVVEHGAELGKRWLEYSKTRRKSISRFPSEIAGGLALKATKKEKKTGQCSGSDAFKAIALYLEEKEREWSARTAQDNSQSSIAFNEKLKKGFDQNNEQFVLNALRNDRPTDWNVNQLYPFLDQKSKKKKGKNKTILMMAAIKNFYETALFLLNDLKADVNTYDEDRTNALYFAAHYDRVALVELFLRHGANARQETKIARLLPLYAAVMQGAHASMFLLLKHAPESLLFRTFRGFGFLELLVSDGAKNKNEVIRSAAWRFYSAHVQKIVEGKMEPSDLDEIKMLSMPDVQHQSVSSSLGEKGFFSQENQKSTNSNAKKRPLDVVSDEEVQEPAAKKQHVDDQDPFRMEDKNLFLFDHNLFFSDSDSNEQTQTTVTTPDPF